MSTPSTASSGLSIEALEWGIGGATLLRDATLHAERGSHVAVIGPSGAGKTTLLRCIAGLVVPKRGRITFGAEVWSNAVEPRVHLAPEKRRIGWIGQELALWPHLTARAHLVHALRWRGVEGARRASEADELLHLAGLESCSEKRPGQLSGGECQRLGLVRALAGGTQLLLLDEPLASLDVVLARELGAKVRDLARAHGTTVVHVTHSPLDVARLADSIAVVEAARIVQTGTLAELRARPATAFVEAFVAVD